VERFTLLAEAVLESPEKKEISPKELFALRFLIGTGLEN